jgi:allene oxide cyclase
MIRSPNLGLLFITAILANDRFLIRKFQTNKLQGPYLTFEDSYITITGGTGIFTGVYGKVKLQQIVFPYKIFYTFYLQGIAKLPEQLTREHVPPSPSSKPSQAAIQCRPNAVAPNFTD